MRVIRETLDENGQVAGTTTTETTTTLMKVDEDGVTLEMEICVDVSGKPMKPEFQTVQQGFHGQPPSEHLQAGEDRDGEVTIEGRRVPCKIIRLELAGPTGKTTTDIYYSATVAPYLLKQRQVTTDPEGKNTLGETTFTVVRLDMPCKVSADIKTSVDVETFRRYSKGTARTWSITSPEIPGGIISYRSKEMDSEGRLIRRSTLELLDYDIEPARERTTLLRRRLLPRKSTDRSVQR